MRRGRFLSVLVAFVTLPVLLTGCFTAPISTTVAQPIRPTQPADVTVLAVMPIVVEGGSEWMRPEAMDALVAGLTERFPGIRIIDPTTAGARLADRSLTSDYAALLADFDRAGVVAPERLEQVRAAVGATHVLHVRLKYSARDAQEVYPNADGNQLHYSTKHQVASYVARLWESGTGPHWEASARSESKPGLWSKDRKPTELLQSLVTSLIGAIPLAGQASTNPQ
jgi:hypothetical protein